MESSLLGPGLSDGLLEALFAGTDELVAVTDVLGRLRYAHVPGGAVPGTLEELFPDNAGAVAEAMHRVLATATPERLEVTGPGEGTRLLLGISPIRDGAHRTGLLLRGTDITALRQEHERLRRIADMMVDTEGIAHFGVWEWDVTQPVAHWTDGLYKIYGVTPETYTPSYEAYLTKVHPDDRERVIAATEGAFHRLQPYSHDERIFHSDGSIRYLHTWAVPMLGPNGTLARLMGVCLDITERKHAELAVEEQARRLAQLNQDLERRVEVRTRALSRAKRAAEDANSSKSLFLATMSHEVRTPMNGVLGMLELLMGTPLSREQQHMLATVRDSSEALLGILDDILDFSKVEAGRLTLESIPVNLRRVVEGVADTLSANARQKQLRLHCYVDPALPDWVLGDEIRLRQILFNLGSNAIKFTHTSPGQVGVVQLRAERQGESAGRTGVALAVIDNGIGMDKAVQSALFTPFTQGDKSTSRRFGGTGLGLSICKRLVDLMAGSLSVTSAPGQGSTFRIHVALPRAEGPPVIDAALVRGLRVLALSPPDPLLEKVGVYLGAAEVRLEVRGTCAEFEAAVAATPAGGEPVLLLREDQLPAGPGEWLAGLRQRTGCAALHGVLLARRQAQAMPPPPPGLERVWIYPLHYQDLLDGLATAAGRMRQPVPLPALASALPQEVLPPPLKPLVLVAEDNVVNQDIIRRQLEFLGYRCLVAGNGEEALALWRSHPVRLLLTDCQMPGMDGFALVRQLRKEEASSGARLPVIALSANVLPSEQRRCREAGMDDFLAKPVRLAGLQQALAHLLAPPGMAAPGET